MKGSFDAADWISITLALIVILGTVAAPLAADSRLLPDESFCLSQRVVGVECPGCGMTRSVVALGRGEISRALTLNWVAPAMLLLALAHLGVRGARIFGRAPAVRAFDLASIAVVIVILIARSVEIWT